MYIAWLFPIRSLSISLQKNYKTGKRKYPVEEENALLVGFFLYLYLFPRTLGTKYYKLGGIKKKNNRNLSFPSSEAGIPKSRC